LKAKKLLDSYALLAYLNKEKNFQKIKKVLSEAQSSGRPLLMNEINIGETYYILYRKRSQEKAEFFLDTVLPSLSITVLSNSFEDIMAAARIKAEYPLSFADCFAAATARRENAIVLTGDPEFRKIAHMVTVDWL
jgi:uncharacterized protein